MTDEKSLGTRAGQPYIDGVELLEREREVDVLGSAAAQVAAGGQGAGFALTGDSGAGKSALVDAVYADARGLRVLRTHCDPLFTPRPLGPFRDLAHVPGLEDVGRRDDALLPEVCEQVFDVLRQQPTLLVVEDVHWVDAASVDVLRFLARRIETMPMLLLVTYRDTEIGPRHAARPLLGDLATLDGLSTLQLAPLSVDAVKRLAHDTALDATRVHAVTGGNPFFVTQVVKEPGLPMPSSVRDAILARVVDVPTEDFEVLQLVATAPDRLDDRVLPRLGVDLPTLRRLDDTGLLSRTETGIVFRHELARLALESTIPPGGGSRLHGRLLEALELVEPREPALLTHHAVLARDSARAATICG
ncbi:MAG TPA: AAA family ATPase [Nocardioides sp.]|nr:AAA family ATPase [Nocardioides sp.]